MSILAVDPGLITGLAMTPGLDPTVEAWSAQLPYLEAMDMVMTLAHTHAPEFVVENFIVNASTAKKTFQPEALKQIGICEWIAHRFALPFSLQLVADAKGFVTDKRLKALGLHRPSPGGHMNDALRHLVLHAVNNGWQDQRLVL